MKAWPLILLAAGVGVGVAMKPKTASAAELVDHDALFKKWGARYGVDWRLIKAHAMAESSLDPSAVNPSDPSYGLGQVLCTADGPDAKCKNKFYVDRWDEATPNRLMDPDFNLMIAAQIIASNIRAHGMPRAVAVYNRWASRHEPLKGPFTNQAYVNRVLGHYRELGGAV